MGRVLAIDWGERRLGLALSDPTRLIASPLPVLPRAPSRQGDLDALRALVAEHEVERVVVGLPLRTDGRPGPEAERVLEVVARLRDALPVPVETVDERFSSAEARRAMAEGLDTRRQRGKVDSVAASLFLQTWLQNHPRGEG